MDSAGASFAASVRMGFMIDVAGYGSRSTRGKIDLQRRVSELVDEVLQDIGLRLTDTHYDGTGDGMAVFLPGDVEVPRVLARLLRSAAEALAEDNRRYRDRMRLRLAAVIGTVGPAAIGFSGDAIVEAARLMDSDELRTALAERPGADLVALVSDHLYRHAVGQRHTGLRAEDFQALDVRAKEFRGRGWLWNGPTAAPPGPTAPPETYGLTVPHATPCVLGIRSGRIERIHDVDIWVNSENTDMEMARFNESSISSSIRYNGARRDAGGRVVDDVIADELVRVVGRHRPVAPGAAFVTGSGTLFETHAVRRIIHVAAVHGEPGAGFRQVRQVGACVANVLWLAERLAAADTSIRTIVFPLLGAGVAGGSVPRTATELVTAAVDYLGSAPGTLLRGIYFLGHTDTERAALAHALGAHPSLRAAPRPLDDLAAGPIRYGSTP